MNKIEEYYLTKGFNRQDIIEYRNFQRLVSDGIMKRKNLHSNCVEKFKLMNSCIVEYFDREQELIDNKRKEVSNSVLQLIKNHQREVTGDETNIKISLEGDIMHLKYNLISNEIVRVTIRKKEFRKGSTYKLINDVAWLIKHGAIKNHSINKSLEPAPKKVINDDVMDRVRYQERYLNTSGFFSDNKALKNLFPMQRAVNNVRAFNMGNPNKEKLVAAQLQMTIGKTFKYLVTAMRLESGAIEVITNTTDIENKVGYLLKTYGHSDAMTHMANDEIKIIDVMIG